MKVPFVGVPLFRGALSLRRKTHDRHRANPPGDLVNKWITTQQNNYISTTNSDNQQSTTHFQEVAPGYSYSVGSMEDSTFGVADTPDASLADFFSRPIRTRSFSWSPSTTLFQTWNPWQDFFTQSRVINRINNFNNLRCKLCVKIIVNGNGFYFGRALVSYVPFTVADDFTVQRAFFTQDLVEASQRPKIFINPTTSEGGELCLPFIWNGNALSIPASDWTDMGQLTLASFSALKHANGSTDPITITVYSWAEDVVLSVPTSVSSGELVPQCGLRAIIEDFEEDERPPRATFRYTEDETVVRLPNLPAADAADLQYFLLDAFGIGTANRDVTLFEPQPRTRSPSSVATDLAVNLSPQAGSDEYGQGVISKPASIIAKAAGALVKAPVIGAYALATQMAASAVSSIASIFGMSRPTNLDQVGYYRTTPLGNLANTNIPDSCQRLSLDAKQEVTIDPRVVGMGGDDEMSIASIVTRESFLTQFTWVKGQNAGNTALIQLDVTPVIWNPLSLGTYPEIHMPACCFAALPFNQWHGTMKYRFQVLSSNYHKGRLRVVYDPYGFGSTEPDFNTNYNYIIDLEHENDFTMSVGWGTNRPFCNINHPGLTTPVEFPPWLLDTNAANVGGPSTNGVLRVYIVNELTTPNDVPNNDVIVNVYVSAGDDMNFQNPSENLQTYTYFTPQAGEAEADSDETTEQDKPVAQTPDETILSSSAVSPYNHVFYGETIKSLRQLFKRYNYHSSVFPNIANSNGGEFYAIMNDFPYYKGNAPGALYPVTNPNPGLWNYSKMTMINYFTPAFVCRRGSMRWKALNTTTTGNGKDGYGRFSVTRLANPSPFGTGSFDQPVQTSTETEKQIFANAALNSGVAGQATTHCDVMPTLEYELPYYREARFDPARAANFTTSTFNWNSAHRLDLDVHDNGAWRHRMDLFCSTGEDFSLCMYLSPPILYAAFSPT